MRVSFIILFFSLLACKTKQKGKTNVYDAASVEQFIVAISKLEKPTAITSTDSLLNKVAKDSSSFTQLTRLLGKYFGDPNSPYGNEELYMHVLQTNMQSQWCDSLSKAGIRKELYLRMQNRPGAKANDFTYLTASGIKKRMYDLHADFTLLYFYNPECEACKEMKMMLEKSEIIKSTIESGQLNLLAIYTDKDETIWRKHLPEMPQTWVHGRDEDEYLYENKIYNLKAIPTIYLLDKDKIVLLKDCIRISEIEQLVK